MVLVKRRRKDSSFNVGRPPLACLASLSLLALTGTSLFASVRIQRASVPPDRPPVDPSLAPGTEEVPGTREAGFASPTSSVGGKGDVIEDGSAATVMAFAMNYDLLTHRTFVGSLRTSGFKGSIILGVEPGMSDNVRDYLLGKGVTLKTLKFVNCTYTDLSKEYAGGNAHARERLTCADPYPNIKVRWSRFPLLRDWLEECEACTGPVLISDYRDAFFQGNPFADGDPAISGLQVFEEHNSITTNHWLVQVPVKACKGVEFGEKPMLCSGTTIGEREAMLRYLNVMYEEMQVWISDPKCHFKINGDDQSIHNYLFYSGKLPFATPFPHRTGIVHTVGAQGSIVLNAHRKRLKMEKGLDEGQASRTPYDGADEKNWIGLHYNLTDSEGFFTNADGTRSRVIHQYDRFGPNYFFTWLQRQQGKLWE